VATSLVLTVIGPDRPGLVETLSQTVADHGANWLESRMARLGGQFAGLLRVGAPEDRAADLVRALEALSSAGLSVQLAETDADEPGEVRRALGLELLGADRPGIIHEISQALAQHGVNVEELETAIVSAPMSGEMLFRARARMSVPAGASLDHVREALEKIAADLMVDLSLDESE